MNKSITPFLLLFFIFFTGNYLHAACPTSDITLSSQTDVDDFATNYPGCTTIPAGVEITVKGSGITNLEGLKELTAIDGQLEIEDCPDLTTIFGLRNITVVNPEGEIEIENCDALTSLHGLHNLETCHDLEIKKNAALWDLSSLEKLTEVSGELKIKDNPSLTSLDGLHNITSVGGGPDNDSQPNGLFIYDNDNLTDCIGLCNLLNNGVVSGDVFVENNGSYPCNDINNWEIECELIALPVELVSFWGTIFDRYNLLEWQTESEENAMVFLLERSLDGNRNFTEIGRVEAAGNSSYLRSYEMKDENPVSLAYYRLRIVDFDGTFEFSDVIVMERSKTDIDLVEVYPVPAEEEVTVLVHAKSTGKAILTISDFLGRKIKQEKIELKAGVNHYVFDFGEHETNFYYLTIYNGKEKIAKKILRASKD